MSATSTAFAPRLEPMGLGALFDRSIRLYGDNFPLVIGIAAIGNLVPMGLALLLGDGNSLAGGLLRIVHAFVNIVALMFVNAAVVRAVSDRYLGNDVTVMTALGAAWERFGTLIGAQLRMMLWIMLGFLLLLVPGILWMLSYALVMMVVMIEGHRGRPALDRSWELVKGERGKVFLVFTVIGILSMVVTFGVGALFGQLPAMVSGETTTFSALLGALVGILIQPLGHIALVLLYYDLRIRKEGFDLEVLGQEMARR